MNSFQNDGWKSTRTQTFPIGRVTTLRNGSTPSFYTNEVASDFAYLPFGGGARKCVGDQFATLEATVTLAMVLRRFSFQFDLSKLAETGVDVMSHPQDLNHPVGMRTGATIHTRKGLNM